MRTTIIQIRKKLPIKIVIFVEYTELILIYIEIYINTMSGRIKNMDHFKIV